MTNKMTLLQTAMDLAKGLGYRLQAAEEKIEDQKDKIATLKEQLKRLNAPIELDPPIAVDENVTAPHLSALLASGMEIANQQRRLYDPEDSECRPSWDSIEIILANAQAFVSRHNGDESIDSSEDEDDHDDLEYDDGHVAAIKDKVIERANVWLNELTPEMIYSNLMWEFRKFRQNVEKMVRDAPKGDRNRMYNRTVKQVQRITVMVTAILLSQRKAVDNVNYQNANFVLIENEFQEYHKKIMKFREAVLNHFDKTVEGPVLPDDIVDEHSELLNHMHGLEEQNLIDSVVSYSKKKKGKS